MSDMFILKVMTVFASTEAMNSLDLFLSIIFFFEITN